jgi:hypothetical protein
VEIDDWVDKFSNEGEKPSTESKPVCHFCENLLQKEIDGTDFAYICNSCIHFFYGLINENKTLKKTICPLKKELDDACMRNISAKDEIDSFKVIVRNLKHEKGEQNDNKK